jgi:aldose 1-epimerase
MDDKLPAKAAGKHLCQFAGVALETQHAPDSPNRPEWPTVFVRAGETYRTTTEFRFGAE